MLFITARKATIICKYPSQFLRGIKLKKYSPPSDVEDRFSCLCEKVLKREFKQLSRSYVFSNKVEKFEFLTACINEFRHPIPSCFLHELDGLEATLNYFLNDVRSEDRLQDLASGSGNTDALPSNLVIQTEPLRYNPDEKSFFHQSAYPGQSTIVCGLAECRKYQSVKVGKDRRNRIDAGDLV